MVTHVTFNIETDENDYLKERTVCKSCYNENRRKKNNNILIQKQRTKIDNVKNSKNNRTLIIEFSNCGKTYLMNKAIFKITKSLNQLVSYYQSSNVR